MHCQNLDFGERILELQIGVASVALELSFVACLILIKLRIADVLELFLWQRVVGFVAHVVLIEFMSLKNLQIAEKALRSSFMMIAHHKHCDCCVVSCNEQQ